MGTTLRAELSEKNPYWIEKHRYYELKHFCLQYPIWKKAYAALDGTNTKTMNLIDLYDNGEKPEHIAKILSISEEDVRVITDEFE